MVFPEKLPAFIWSHRKEVLPGMVLALGRSLAIAPFPLFFKTIIDDHLPQENVFGIIKLTILFLLLLVVFYVLAVRGARTLGESVAKIVLRLRSRLFQTIQMLSLSYLSKKKSGWLLSKYAFDTQKIDLTIMPLLNWVLPTCVYAIITLSILIYMDWRLSIIVVLLFPLILFMRLRFHSRLRSTNENARKASEMLSGSAGEWLGALQLVRSFGEEKQVGDKLYESSSEVAKARVETIEVNNRFSAFSFSSGQVLTMAVVAGGSLLTLYGNLSTGTLLAFIAAMPTILMPLMIFTHFSEQYFLGQAAYKSVREVLSESSIDRWEGSYRPDSLHGEIAFNNISFAYENTSKGALSDIDLTIAPGEKIALVGPSGSGKSTFASVLLGLYPTETGTLTIDGRPLSDYDMEWYRKQIAIVLQESILFSGTIYENITFGNVNASREEVIDAARQAHACPFIEELAEGFDTVVGERGVRLSGGQRQRISIARALLRKPAILILDEPTSALDYATEASIQESLDLLAKGRTVITIAHRLSTIKDADRIVVLEGGVITEQGDFSTLSTSGGYFEELLQKQRALTVSLD